MSNPDGELASYTVGSVAKLSQAEASECVKRLQAVASGPNASCTYNSDLGVFYIQSDKQDGIEALSRFADVVTYTLGPGVDQDEDTQIDDGLALWESVNKAQDTDPSQTPEASTAEADLKVWQPSNPQATLDVLSRHGGQNHIRDLSRLAGCALEIDLERQQIYINGNSKDSVERARDLLSIFERHLLMASQCIIGYLVELEHEHNTQLRFVSTDARRNRLLRESIVALDLRSERELYILRDVKQQKTSVGWSDYAPTEIFPSRPVRRDTPGPFSKIWSGFRYKDKIERSVKPAGLEKRLLPESGGLVNNADPGPRENAQRIRQWIDKGTTEMTYQSPPSLRHTSENGQQDSQGKTKQTSGPYPRPVSALSRRAGDTAGEIPQRHSQHAVSRVQLSQPTKIGKKRRPISIRTSRQLAQQPAVLSFSQPKTSIRATKIIPEEDELSETEQVNTSARSVQVSQTQLEMMKSPKIEHEVDKFLDLVQDEDDAPTEAHNIPQPEHRGDISQTGQYGSQTPRMGNRDTVSNFALTPPLIPVPHLLIGGIPSREIKSARVVPLTDRGNQQSRVPSLVSLLDDDDGYVQVKIQEEDEVAERTYRRTMRQKKAPNTSPSKRPNNAEKLLGAVTEMFTLAKAHRGEVLFHVDLGRVLAKGIHPQYARQFLPEEWDNVFIEPDKSTVIFTDMLTKLVADVESIIDMRTAGDRRLFVALPNMKEVIYEFECINKDGDIINIEVDSQLFNYIVRAPSRAFGSVFIFYPERTWDACVNLTGKINTFEHAETAEALISSLSIPAGQVYPSLTMAIPQRDLQIQSVVVKRRTRHPAMDQGPSRHRFALEVTEVQELFLERDGSLQDRQHAFATSPELMIADPDGSRLWYEARLVVLDLDEPLKENLSLETVVDEAKWIPEELATAQMVGQLYALVGEVVRGIDAVGIPSLDESAGREDCLVDIRSTVSSRRPMPQGPNEFW